MGEWEVREEVEGLLVMSSAVLIHGWDYVQRRGRLSKVRVEAS